MDGSPVTQQSVSLKASTLKHPHKMGGSLMINFFIFFLSLHKFGNSINTGTHTSNNTLYLTLIDKPTNATVKQLAVLTVYSSLTSGCCMLTGNSCGAETLQTPTIHAIQQAVSDVILDLSGIQSCAVNMV